MKKKYIIGIFILLVVFVLIFNYFRYDIVFGDEELVKERLSFTNLDMENYQKPSNEDLKKGLTGLQYYVTQEDGTEKPFDNEYWDNHEEGIYIDVVSGEPLFSSTDKFDSGTGWPSFLRPINTKAVTEHDDYKLVVKRIEVRSKVGDSHLGHILLDGPVENNRVRYCINSASLRFVPKDEMESEGYVSYLKLFKNENENEK